MNFIQWIATNYYDQNRKKAIIQNIYEFTHSIWMFLSQ